MPHTAMRTVNMPRLASSGSWLCLPCRLVQAFQNAAISRWLAAGALQAQRTQFFFKCLEFLDALHDMAHMGIEQAIDLRTVFFRRVLEMQQGAHFAQRHVQ